MVYQLFATLRNSVAIAITLLLTSKVPGLASEYIFTAPPEVDHELVEVPDRETEYPLYECDTDRETESETALDSHNCNCIDCDDITQDAESDGQLTSKNKPNKQ